MMPDIAPDHGNLVVRQTFAHHLPEQVLLSTILTGANGDYVDRIQIKKKKKLHFSTISDQGLV